MEHFELNLTRKWRSKNFQEVVGQTLAVRILQNSLYLKQFFPVYLFAGQRGCGKTSTARIFAAAVNCARLPEFQQDPRQVTVPCLECQSCKAMAQGQHPDFIEIDAASHTGVDNIRNIIDASSFLPLLSDKKIYLLDEAHMLSKAAFNAFLKILEEPPMSVIFILATTDVQKILETVKSRCFQIFFDAVEIPVIQDHLEKLCIAENILFDRPGLQSIAREAGGSVRDAINLLERVRFATKKISEESVQSILGHVDEKTLFRMFQVLVTDATIQDLLVCCVSLEKYELSIEYLWNQLLELVYDAILIQYQVAPRYYTALSPEQISIIKGSSMYALHQLFGVLCNQEQFLARTTKKLRFLEMTLLEYKQRSLQIVKKKIIDDQPVQDSAHQNAVQGQDLWAKFIMHAASFDDLILVAMFQDAQFIGFDNKTSIVTVSFLKKFLLFQDSLEKEKQRWMVLLQKTFGHTVQLQYTFEHVGKEKTEFATQMANKMKNNSAIRQQPDRQTKNTIDVSDTSAWKLAHELMKHFDGVLTELSEDSYE